MRKFILDLTGSDVDLGEPYNSGDKLIECVQGEYDFEYDVVMDKLPKAYIDQVNSKGRNVGRDHTIPIGFDESMLPDGVVVYPVKP